MRLCLTLGFFSLLVKDPLDTMDYGNECQGSDRVGLDSISMCIDQTATHVHTNTDRQTDSIANGEQRKDINALERTSKSIAHCAKKVGMGRISLDR